MADSPLSDIQSFGAPTLENLELSGAGSSARVRGKNRQYVRFYKEEVLELHTDKVRINQKTGDAVPLSCKMVPVEREMVHIITPGDKNETIAMAESFHRIEHFPAYQAYKQGKGAPIGQAIDDCPYISSAMATELRAMSIKTEEQLADAADYLCQQLANGWELREYARARCQARNSNKANTAQFSIVRAELEKSQALILKMQQEMSELKGQVLDVSGKPTRSKKNKEQVQNEAV